MVFGTGYFADQDQSGSNIGTGLGVYKETTADKMLFRKLKAGTDITLTSGADDITITASSSSISWQEVSTDTELEKDNGYFADVSAAALELTLPPAPSLGDRLYIADHTGNAETYNITVNRNGKKIENTEENLVIDIDRARVTLVFSGTDRGWIVLSGINYFRVTEV